jgi:outer membrane protein assembly factor BamE
MESECRPCGAWRAIPPRALAGASRATRIMLSAMSSRFFSPRLLCGVFCVFLTACSGASPTSFLKPYRPDVRQGNYLDAPLLEALKPGLTRDQVRFLLGSPPVVDLFNPNRWDYVYRFEPGRGGHTVYRRIGLVFEQDRLAHIEASGFEAQAGLDALGPNGGALR